MGIIKFFRGERSHYKPDTLHKDAIYFCVDTKEIMVNNISYGFYAEGQQLINDITYLNYTLTLYFTSGQTKVINLDRPIIIDSLDSTRTDASLSANQGKALNNNITSLTEYTNNQLDSVRQSIKDTESNLNQSVEDVESTLTQNIEEVAKQLTDKVTSLGKVYNIKGSVQDLASLLDIDTVKQGDVYNVVASVNLNGVTYNGGTNFVYIGTTDNQANVQTNWDSLGGLTDLSDYYTSQQVDNLLNQIKQTIATVQVDIEDINTDIDELVAKDTNLQQQIDTINSTLDTTTDNITTIESNIDNIEQDITDVNEDIQELQDTVNNNNSSISSLNSSINDLETFTDSFAGSYVENITTFNSTSTGGQISFTKSNNNGNQMQTGIAGNIQIPNATSSANGLMSSADKQKLDSLSGEGGGGGTESYVLPIATSTVLGGVKSTTTGTTGGRDYNVQVNADGTMKVNVPWVNTTYNNATQSTDGLLSSEDKVKLDNLDNLEVGDKVQVQQVISSGTHIATITVDDVDTDIFAPSQITSIDWSNVTNKQIATDSNDGLMSKENYVKLQNLDTEVSQMLHTEVVTQGEYDQLTTPDSQTIYYIVSAIDIEYIKTVNFSKDVFFTESLTQGVQENPLTVTMVQNTYDSIINDKEFIIDFSKGYTLNSTADGQMNFRLDYIAADYKQYSSMCGKTIVILIIYDDLTANFECIDL